ncbi:MAG: FKBP-type peptidyl-prolyl cis-trans isomerase [Bacteroidota bacterium]
MKQFVLSLVVVALGISSTLNGQVSMDSVSYSLGVLMAGNLKKQGFDEIEAISFAKAIEAVMKGETPSISVQEASQLVAEYQRKKLAGEGEDFLAKNAERPEVQVTESGLQYEVLKPSEGVKPTPSNKVKVHYHGTLIDGTVFDSSVDRGKPTSFGVTQVIQGWVEGLQLMPLGSKYKFYIPYQLAYGERGTRGIPPYSALIFEVELLEIN